MDSTDVKLSSLSVNGLCDLLEKIQDINPNKISNYKEIIRENNINGKVILHCDLTELKNVSKLKFKIHYFFKLKVTSKKKTI